MPTLAASYVPPLLGGALIGLSAIMMLQLSGRIAGVSGAVASLLRERAVAKSAAPAMFVAGLLLAPWMMTLAKSVPPATPHTASLPMMALAGLLVGAGALLANGCTSGHGVCGLARFSGRSLAAVLVFMTSAILTVALRRVLGGLA